MKVKITRKSYFDKNIMVDCTHLVWSRDRDRPSSAGKIIAHGATQAAKQYADVCHSQRNGYEWSWPVTFRVFDIATKTLVDVEVERQHVPEFFVESNPAKVDVVLCAECKEMIASCTGLYENPCRQRSVKPGSDCEVLLELCTDELDKPACDMCCDHLDTDRGHCHPLKEMLPP